MDFYRKPAFDKFLPTTARHRRPRYPYDRDMYRKYDVFELFPMDGGGFFFTQQHLGGSATENWLKALKSGALLRPWAPSAAQKRSGRLLDWHATYDDSKPAGYLYQTVEQHVWLHRLYFLLPLAQQYLRTGDRRWARLWFGYFRDWAGECPPPRATPDDPGPGRRYIWRDMQVTWRLVVMIHSVFMLGSRPGALTADEWAAVYRMIEIHARRVNAEALRHWAKGGAMNHFLQKGMALVLAGTMYPEFEDAGQWVESGRKVVRMHMRHTYPDGGSVEACPSYSHFISGLYLGAHVLLKANGKRPVAGLRRSLAKQYEFLAQTASPDWRSLQLGDSYALDVRRDIEIVRRLFPLRRSGRSRSVCFRTSQFAVLRSRRTAVYLDAMPGGLWHIHRGKPNVLAFHRGRPVLIDSGCVNYDRDAEREGYLKGRAAHNVVTVEPVERDEWPGKETAYAITRWRPDARGGEVTARCTYRGQGAKYVWTRKLRLTDDVLRIEDRVRADRRASCALHFHLAACSARSGPGGLSAAGPGWTLDCVCRGGSGGALRPSVKKRLAIDDANRRFQAPHVVFSQSGRAAVFRTVLRFAAGAKAGGK